MENETIYFEAEFFYLFDKLKKMKVSTKHLNHQLILFNVPLRVSSLDALTSMVTTPIFALSLAFSSKVSPLVSDKSMPSGNSIRALLGSGPLE